MTTQRDLKKIIRARQQKTGASYTTARAHVMRDRAKLLGLEPPESAQATPARAEAVVLKINQRSARVRILGESGEVTFRSGDVWNVIPGHVVTLVIDRRWIWHDDAYASGKIENPRIDVDKMGLVPLPLKGGELVDVAEDFEHPSPGEAGYEVWMRVAAKPRPAYVFDPIAWGAFPGSEPEENLTCDAAELMEAGDYEGARELLMEALTIDMRCIDAHCHLGNLEFDRSPARAMRHYEMGLRIGEASLPRGYDGLLLWSIDNRPYLRCLHNYGLCLWRLDRFDEARKVFERNVAFNPNDNQGSRFCLQDVLAGRRWKEDRLQVDQPQQPGAREPELGEDTTGEDAFHRIWVKQAAATLDLRERFGLMTALNYLVGEKLFNFVEAADTRPEFAKELPKFVAWIREHFKPSELAAILTPTRTRGMQAYFGTGTGSTVRDRRRLERIRFLLVDSGKIN